MVKGEIMKIYKVSQCFYHGQEDDILYWDSLDKAEIDFQKRITKLTASRKYATKEECVEHNHYRSEPIVVDDTLEFDYVKRVHIAFWIFNTEIIDNKIVETDKWNISNVEIYIEEIDVN